MSEFEYTHPIVEMSNSFRKYHRAEELLRFLALFIDLLAMTVGLIRAWRWWFAFDAIGDLMCIAKFTKNITITYEDTSCGTIITDWSSATYSNCVQFEPAVGWFLIIVFTAVCVVLLVGLIAMRGYIIWAVGIVGSAILVVLSGLQSVYSTQGYCVQFVAILMKLPNLPNQVLSHRSLINLWWYRTGFRQWLVNLFTIHG
ncbi:5618_t:CDS:1 [Dentiscutata erythropus]|uniref:5618_t:CDS:1 n=1 Tax=Dentiscutata erythropus TaxID=1348616 RepID=A0A9N9I7M3_9GLOM|nr:5618_t:CDS:1 [Dentiscutata erythropus]